MRGFHTRSFPDLVSVHHRPLASADGALRGHARHGECAYIVHYGPLWVALRSLKVARRAPLGLSGLAFLYGYCAARRGAWSGCPTRSTVASPGASCVDGCWERGSARRAE